MKSLIIHHSSIHSRPVTCNTSKSSFFLPSACETLFQIKGSQWAWLRRKIFHPVFISISDKTSQFWIENRGEEVIRIYPVRQTIIRGRSRSGHVGGRWSVLDFFSIIFSYFLCKETRINLSVVFSLQLGKEISLSDETCGKS